MNFIYFMSKYSLNPDLIKCSQRYVGPLKDELIPYAVHIIYTHL